MAPRKKPRRSSLQQARNESERQLLIGIELEEARRDIEQHEVNAEKRASGLGDILKRSLAMGKDQGEMIKKILQAEVDKRQLAEETLPRVAKNASKADWPFSKRLFNRDVVEVIILIGIGGAIYAASPEFFRLIIGLVTGNGGEGN